MNLKPHLMPIIQKFTLKFYNFLLLQMLISCRDSLFKSAANINQYPWNVSPDSEVSPDERPETGIDEIANDEFVKVKVKEGPLTVDKNFINWETINQLGLPEIREKEVKFTRSKK